MVLHDRLGILAANAVSTSAGMAFSFVANGRLRSGPSGSRRVTRRCSWP
jgi:hypothetical protein